MTPEQLKKKQAAERDHFLQEILKSKAPKKLIVAGAGTGKTFTFSQLLKLRAGGPNLAMTFIKRLVGDMEPRLGATAEVKTFHSYCKKVLHEQNGKVELAPFLTKVIQKDAELVGNGLSDFDSKFQTLDEGSPELSFHLSRGDYYDAVGFDDAVYRLYKILKRDSSVLPSFDQIVIDEFQDFHPLEVAFIDELAKKGNILIVGDDDQAVYHRRNASPEHLRNIHRSSDFKNFDLPFCSRCPDAVIQATNALIARAQKADHLIDRIEKRYECYFQDKESDSNKYPKILLAVCSVARTIPKYIQSALSQIDPQDIEESHTEGQEYPTVLIVGPKQYLHEVDKYFKKAGLSFDYAPSDEITYGIVDAYKWLLTNIKSNLGWRILLEIFFDETEQKRVVSSSQNGGPLSTLMPPEFVANHTKAITMVRAVQREEENLSAVEDKLRDILGEHFDEIAGHFSPKEAEETEAVDKSKPSILLTSFVGCKGLSAGHVFIIGAHNGSIPRNPDAITDVEISQFIVALTRTRKQCHIISNEWLIMPKDKKGQWIPAFEKSTIASWIPDELIENRGKVTAKSFTAGLR